MPSTVVVNNTTLIHKTTVINNIKRETRDFGGSGPQKVVVNEGPGLEVVQKATGKKVEMASIREVARQTPAPPASPGAPRTRSAPGAAGGERRPMCRAQWCEQANAVEVALIQCRPSSQPARARCRKCFRRAPRPVHGHRQSVTL